MNVLKRISQSSGVKNIPLEHLIYCALLSDCSTRDTEVVSAIDEATVYDQYEGLFDEKQIDEALDFLEDKGLVSMDSEGYFILGEKRGAKVHLFSAVESDLQKFQDKAMEMFDSFIKGASSAKKSYAKGVKGKVEELLEKGISSWKCGEFLDFYSYLYSAYMGGEVYSFTWTGKPPPEAGMINQSIKKYSKEKLFTMIVEFISNSTYYTKKAPSVNLFHYYRDEILMSLKGGGEAKSKEYMREEKEDQGF